MVNPRREAPRAPRENEETVLVTVSLSAGFAERKDANMLQDDLNSALAELDAGTPCLAQALVTRLIVALRRACQKASDDGAKPYLNLCLKGETAVASITTIDQVNTLYLRTASLRFLRQHQTLVALFAPPDVERDETIALAVSVNDGELLMEVGDPSEHLMNLLTAPCSAAAPVARSRLVPPAANRSPAGGFLPIAVGHRRPDACSRSASKARGKGSVRRPSNALGNIEFARL